MSVEGAIHVWWATATDAATVALRALLPANKVVTGQQQDENASLPYATINRESSPVTTRTNCNAIDSTLIRLQIWHENFDEGQAIKDAAIECFDPSDFNEFIADGVRIFDIRKANDLNFQEDDGVWQFLIDFLVGNHKT